MSETTKIENEVKSEVAKIEDDVKIDFHKVMAILRALLPGDHEVISEVKKLAASSPELQGSTLIGSTSNALISSSSAIPDSGTFDPKPVDTIGGIGGGE